VTRVGSRLRIALVVVALSAGAAATLAEGRPAGSFLIQTSASFQRLGDYWVSDEPTYQGAIDALGAPSGCRLVNGNPTWVTATWRTLGVWMNLVTFGGMPSGKTGCTAPKLIQVSTIRVTGRRWYTSRKLRVGDSVARLRGLYPNAPTTNGVQGWYNRGYWLVTRRSRCLGDCGDVVWETVPVLVAETKAGKVASIVFVVGAQGE
jgi:hypothetical protein